MVHVSGLRRVPHLENWDLKNPQEKHCPEGMVFVFVFTSKTKMLE